MCLLLLLEIVSDLENESVSCASRCDGKLYMLVKKKIDKKKNSTHIADES